MVREAGELAPRSQAPAGPARHATCASISDRRALSVPVTDRLAALTQTIGSLPDEGITVEDVAVRRPTLDDAFLHLTGQQALTAPSKPPR